MPGSRLNEQYHKNINYDQSPKSTQVYISALSQFCQFLFFFFLKHQLRNLCDGLALKYTPRLFFSECSASSSGKVLPKNIRAEDGDTYCEILSPGHNGCCIQELRLPIVTSRISSQPKFLYRWVKSRPLLRNY